MRKESKEEWVEWIYVQLNHSAIHLKLTCCNTVNQLHFSKKKKKKENQTTNIVRTKQCIYELNFTWNLSALASALEHVLIDDYHFVFPVGLIT